MNTSTTWFTIDFSSINVLQLFRWRKCSVQPSMLNLHKNEIFSTKIQCCIKACLLQKIVGHVMFGTCLRLLGFGEIAQSRQQLSLLPCICRLLLWACICSRTSTLAWSPWSCVRRNGGHYQVQGGGVCCAGSTTTHSHGLSAGSRQNINSAKRCWRRRSYGWRVR